MSKTCTKCGVEKPVTEFHKDCTRKDGRSARCKPCALKHVRAWQEANPEKVAEGKRRYRERNKDKVAGYFLAYRYGITLEEYEELVTHQEGRCAVCGKPQGEDSKCLNVDHDHDTGLVRGILCGWCNSQIENGKHPDQAAVNQYLDHPPAQAVLGEHRVPGW